MAERRQSKTLSNGNVFDYLTKYGILILSIIFVVPYIYQYIKDSIDKSKVDDLANQTAVSNAQNSLNNPQIQMSKANVHLRDECHFDTKTRERLMTSAKKIADGFQTNSFKWYNPTTWVEDDKAVYYVLKAEVNNYKHLEWLYYNVYTESRNLSTDINKYLDSDLLNNLRKHYTNYGKKNLF